MANYFEIGFTSTNLTTSEYQFTLELKSCYDENWIEYGTGLTYSDFPVYINTDEDVITATCYNYRITEQVTSLSCEGQAFTVTPTPTPSVTPTMTPTPTSSPTPTITPTSSVTPSVTLTPSVTPTTTPSGIPSGINTVFFRFPTL